MTLALTLDTPSGGTTVEAPLGNDTSFVMTGAFSGASTELDLSSLSISVDVDGRSFDAVVNAQTHRYRADVLLRCPSQPRVAATLNTRRWADVQPHGHWVYAHAHSPELTLTVRDTTSNPAYAIVCRCVDDAGQPLTGLDVEAYDRDPKSPDDKLGSTARTDADGLAEFHFHRGDFTEHPGERNPDVYFKIWDRGTALTYLLPGERSDHGMMRNFVPRPEPVVVHVLGRQGYAIGSAIHDKWVALGGPQGPFGRPTGDEGLTPGGQGRYAHFEGGSIYWTADWGAHEVHGLIRQRWADLGWEQGFLGFPVTDELAMPGSDGGRCNVFEHGVVTWLPGQTEAMAGPHHYERLYGALRAHILSRFYAVGPKGRRNQLSLKNRLLAPLPADPAQAAAARWRIAATDNENPWLFGSLVHTAMAVEHAVGNAESGRVLQASLTTLASLMDWAEPGHEATARLPQRWDAGLPDGGAGPGDQFLVTASGTYGGALRATDIHHLPRRANATLDVLLGPTGAELYLQRLADHWQRYRRWELSMDEVVGLATSCWVIGKLATTPPLSGTVAGLTAQIGNYLADHAYLLVRPMGGLAWRGASGMLPAMEWPIARALGAASGTDFHARTNFVGAMQRAGYWGVLQGPVTRWQLLGWSTAALLSVLAPGLAGALAMRIASLEAIIAGQVLSPGTLAAACAVYLHRDCFDVNGVEGKNDEQTEAAMALLASDAPNKAGLFDAVTTAQAAFASFSSWSVNFPAWLGLTGLDDSDATTRTTFAQWFAARQLQTNDKEPKGLGSRSLFAAAVAALVIGDATSESRLVAGLERGIVELFRDCYFDPQLPVIDVDGNAIEVCRFDNGAYVDHPQTPYSPLDWMAACALAFWHARRLADVGQPVTTPRFPQPLDAARFSDWPRIAVPDQDCLDAMTGAGIPIQAVQGNAQPVAGPGGFALFDAPLVPRAAAPTPPAAMLVPANVLMCDITVAVHATATGDVNTGVTLYPGHDIQIEASGDIWAGVPLDARNDPQGLPRLIDDARWPLHTGLDPAANAFCLLGRLNGYFRIGAGRPRTRWHYHEARSLFLRINDDGPGDGNGQFNVRIRVWGPTGADPATVFQSPNVVRTGGLLQTVEAADTIEVTVEPGAVDLNEVHFVLTTPTAITWRKEMIIRDAPSTGTGQWTVWTQDMRHSDANGLYRYQLPGATLEFRKMKGGGGMRSMVTVSGLEAAPPGARVTFNWLHD